MCTEKQTTAVSVLVACKDLMCRAETENLRTMVQGSISAKEAGRDGAANAVGCSPGSLLFQRTELWFLMKVAVFQHQDRNCGLTQV